MVSPLFRSRIDRICDRCGGKINAGDTYHHRDTDQLTVCENCYHQLHDNWQAIHDNFNNEMFSIKNLLMSNPGTFIRQSSFSVPNFTNRIKSLIQKGYTIIGSAEEGYALADCPEWSRFKKELENVETSSELESLFYSLKENEQKWILFKMVNEYSLGETYDRLNYDRRNSAPESFSSKLFRELVGSYSLAEGDKIKREIDKK